MAILIFFVLHWQLSVFAQSFFHHRYVSHRQFTMSPFWEKAAHLFAYAMQGSSYLKPEAYAYLHRMHHAYSDTAKDPHSPHFYPSAWSMMWVTKNRYFDLVRGKEQPETRFAGATPKWEALDAFGDSWISRLLWGTAYTLFYIKFATSPWMYALLPIHFMMGPVHGAIVNWCGHKYGYRNFASDDKSRNTLPWDFLCAGELFQNNHHTFGMSPNFGVRRWEVDPTYLVMKGLDKLGIIQMKASPSMRVTPLASSAPMMSDAEKAEAEKVEALSR